MASVKPVYVAVCFCGGYIVISGLLDVVFIQSITNLCLIISYRRTERLHSPTVCVGAV
jgi:hypothetical protein